MVTAPLERAGDGSFTSSAADFALDLVGLVDDAGQPRRIGPRDVVFRGTLAAAGFATPLTVDGRFVVADVAQLLIELIGFDEEGALTFLAGVYGVPVEELPAEALFHGEVGVVGVGPTQVERIVEQ